jgi:hypothetical protein
VADGQHPRQQFIAAAIRTVHHAQRGEGIQAAAHGRAGDLRFLAELGDGQPLALGVKALRTSSPRARDSIKLGSCSACLALRVLGFSLIEFLSIEDKAHGHHYTVGKKGGDGMCLFYHPITLLTSFNKRVDNRTTFRLSPLTIHRLPYCQSIVTPRYGWGTKSYDFIRKKNMTATVERIESWLVDVPTIRPHKLSMTTMGCQTLVIVRITRSDGICGIGEATTIGGLSYGVESPEAICRRLTIT